MDILNKLFDLVCDGYFKQSEKPRFRMVRLDRVGCCSYAVIRSKRMNNKLVDTYDCKFNALNNPIYISRNKDYIWCKL